MEYFFPLFLSYSWYTQKMYTHIYICGGNRTRICISALLASSIFFNVSYKCIENVTSEQKKTEADGIVQQSGGREDGEEDGSTNVFRGKFIRWPKMRIQKESMWAVMNEPLNERVRKNVYVRVTWCFGCVRWNPCHLGKYRMSKEHTKGVHIRLKMRLLHVSSS